MPSSRVITLFHEPPPARRGPSSVVVSVGLHVVAFVWIYFGLRTPSSLHETASVKHFSVRLFRQDDIEYPASHTPANPAPQPAAHSQAHAASSTPSVEASTPAEETPAQVVQPPAPIPQAALQAPQLNALAHPATDLAPKLASTRMAAAALHMAPAPMPVAAQQPAPPVDLSKIIPKNHTLIQPDVPQDVKLDQIVPLPTIVKWSADSSHDKLIIPPTPQQNSAALAKPSIKLPNREPNPADLKISSTQFKTKLPTLPPSTTSPIVVRRAEPPAHVPETTAKASAPPTPAQIVSLSDLQSKQAVIPVPAANSVSRPTPSTTIATGKTENAPAPATGGPAGKPAATAAVGQTPAVTAGQKSTASGGKPSGADSTAKPASGATAGKTPATGTGAGDKRTAIEKPSPPAVAHNDAGAGSGSTPSVAAGTGTDPLATHITQPKDGQFGVVVVGSSLAEQYPETVSFWSGRLIYTVYLHVGSGKSWILQYSVPRDAAPAGPATKPDAPWPYDMVRPHLEPADFNSDAIMVHGFVNPTGRFDRLAVVFPDQFAKAKTVLNDLQQWQFRPARQNGQTATIEVLLIIPEETE